MEVEGAEVEGCSSRLKGCRLRGRGAEAGGILGVNTPPPNFWRTQKNGSYRGWAIKN